MSDTAEPKKKRRLAAMLKLGLALVAVAAVLGVAGLLVAQRMNASADTIPSAGVLFRIEEGDHLGAISTRLEQSGLVRSATFLKLVSYSRGTQGGFQAGTYLVEAGMSTVAIHDRGKYASRSKSLNQRARPSPPCLRQNCTLLR